MSTKFQREKEALQKLAKKAEDRTDHVLIDLAESKYTMPILLGVVVAAGAFILWLIYG